MENQTVESLYARLADLGANVDYIKSKDLPFDALAAMTDKMARMMAGSPFRQ